MLARALGAMSDPTVGPEIEALQAQACKLASYCHSARWYWKAHIMHTIDHAASGAQQLELARAPAGS